MSDPSSVSSRGASSEAAKTAARKPRSPAERVIVWGGIIVLLGVVAVEARARKGYEWTLSALEKELEKDEGANAEPLYVKNIDQHLIGWPKRSNSESGGYQTITLTWGGLFRSHGIDLTCEKPDGQGGEPAVLGMVTHGAPEPEPPPALTEEERNTVPNTASVPPAGAGAPPGGGGPGGGGFDPMQQDADGDKKISRDEAQGRFKENFDSNDANADGFIDEEEIAAMRERFQNRGPGGGGPGAGGGPQGPQEEFGPGGQRPPARPPSESNDAAGAPAESTSPESSTPEDGSEAPAGKDKAPGEGAP